MGDITGTGGVYWESWYNQGMIAQNVYINCPDGTPAINACPTELADRGILFENKILGLPRRRQVFRLKKTLFLWGYGCHLSK